MACYIIRFVWERGTADPQTKFVQPKGSERPNRNLSDYHLQKIFSNLIWPDEVRVTLLEMFRNQCNLAVEMMINITFKQFQSSGSVNCFRLAARLLQDYDLTYEWRSRFSEWNSVRTGSWHGSRASIHYISSQLCQHSIKVEFRGGPTITMRCRH